MTFIAIKMFNYFELRTVLLISVTIQLTGAWFRMYAFEIDHFWPILAGTAFQSCSHTFLMSSQNLIIT